VYHSDGEVKIWLDPNIELAHNSGLSAQRVVTTLRLVREHEDEIRKAWTEHFGG